MVQFEKNEGSHEILHAHFHCWD